MHHGVADFDAGGETVDDDAAGAALEQRKKRAGERGVLLGEMEGCGQLAIEILGDGDELFGAGAFDEQGRGAEDFL